MRLANTAGLAESSADPTWGGTMRILDHGAALVLTVALVVGCTDEAKPATTAEPDTAAAAPWETPETMAPTPPLPADMPEK